MKKTFRLNRNAFVRHYEDCVYIEHQVSHQTAWLDLDHFDWLKEADYDTLYSADSLPSKAQSLLNELDNRWFIDFSDSSDLSQRIFTYDSKDKIDRLFSSSKPLIEQSVNKDARRIRNLQIELTDMCNERCIHCYLPNYKKDYGKSLDIDTVATILQNYRKNGGLKVVFSGGEIFLHKHLRQILGLCNKLNLMILLQTNLVSFRPKDIEWLKSLNVFNVQVSLYSSDKNIHDDVTRRKGSFCKTLNNIKILRNNDIPMLISCPVMSLNFESVKNLKELSENLKIDIYFDFMMMAQCDGDSQNLASRIGLPELRELLKFRIMTSEAFRNAIFESENEEILCSKVFARRKLMCDILSNSICIDSNGNIYPCPGWNAMILGNIYDCSIYDAWDSPKSHELRNLQHEGFEKCRNCSLENFCDMCAVYNHNENGDMTKICNRFCESAALLKECVLEIFRENKQIHHE